MNIVIIGLNHKSADLAHREIVSKKLLTRDLREKFILELKSFALKKFGKPLIAELSVLSTCNRVEILMVLADKEEIIAEIKDYIIRYFFDDKIKDDKIKIEDASKMFYAYENIESVSHFFSVASSLDSMIIGEPQILGQIKDAYNEACELKITGPIINKLFHKAFYCAKKVRTETKIAVAPVSVSYAAVELARKIFNNINDKKVLLLGTGEMGKIAAKHFIKHGINEIYITNRTRDKAEDLSREIDGCNIKTVIDFAEYYKIFTAADIVLCSTGAENYIIKYDDLVPIIKLRKQKPLFLIDISVPRNIDPEINKIPNVYLFDIDDIGKIIEGNLDGRQKEVSIANNIIESQVKEFMDWKNSLNAVPVIVALRRKVQNILAGELSKYISEDKDLDMAVNSIVNKILHEPMTSIKKKGIDGNDINLMEAVKLLFNLELNVSANPETNQETDANQNLEDKEFKENQDKEIRTSKIKLIK
jgi:glutamyl-tRNA reductase